MINKILAFSGIIMVLAVNQTKGQLPISNDIKQKMYRINRAFDSSFFLGFNIHFNYTSTDTVTGKTESSQRSGAYLVRGSSFRYTLGDIEFMQNDSMAFTVSHQNKVLFVTKKVLKGASNTLPLRAMIDSLIAGYSKYYSINADVNSESGDSSIKFETLNNAVGMPYKSIEISYNKRSNYPTSVKVMYEETDDVRVDTIPGAAPVIRKIHKNKTMDIGFSDYKIAPIDHSSFKNERYIYFDRMKKQYITAEQFRGYKLYINGINPGDD